MYEEMLLPTDGSPEMAPVVDHAVALADYHGASLHGLYVVNTGVTRTLPMDTSWETVSSILEEKGESALASVAEAAGDLDFEGTLVEGPPGESVVSYAEDEDVDLIVMGTHGRGGIDRLVMGSVAEQIVRTSPIPVLTIHVDE